MKSDKILEFLSVGVRTIDKFLKDNGDEISDLVLREKRDVNIIDFTKKHILDKDSTIKKIYNEEKDNINIDFGNSNSFLGYLTQVYAKENNLNEEINKLYDYSEKVKILNKYNKYDNFDFQQIEKFIDNVYSDPSTITESKDFENNIYLNLEKINEHFENTKVTKEDSIDLAKDILNSLENKGSNIGSFDTSNEQLKADIIDKFYDYDLIKKKFGAKQEEENFFNNMIKDIDGSRITVKDVLSNDEIKEKFNNIVFKIDKKEGNNFVSMTELLEHAVQKDERFNDIYIDDYIRKDKNNKLYSFKETNDLKNNIIDEFANTIPGKILKVRDIITAKNQPKIEFIEGLKLDPILASSEKHNNSNLIENNYYNILGRTYKIDINNKKLEHISDLDNTYLISGNHGTSQGIIKSIAGEHSERFIQNRNKYAKFLDLNKNADNTIKDNLSSFFSKFYNPKSKRNILERIMYPDLDSINKVSAILKNPSSTDEQKEIARKFYVNYYNDIKEINKFFIKTTTYSDIDVISKLEKVASKRSKKFFNILKKTDSDLLKEAINLNTSSLHNEDLISLLKQLMRNPEKALNNISIISDNKIIGNNVKALNFTKKIRKEIEKEAYISEMISNKDYNAVNRLFKKAGLSGKKLEQAKLLSNFAIYQQHSKFKINKFIQNIPTIDMMEKAIKDTTLFFSSKENNFFESFRKNIQIIAKDNLSILQKENIDSKNIINAHRNNTYMYMRKAYSPLNIIKNINDYEKLKSSLKEFGGQFIAGRKNINEITTATLFPYFMTHRLVEPLKEVGLGFSNASTGSTLDLVKNIMLKRVLPIAGGLTALSYLDYRVDAYTGTSLKGRLANGIANTNLAIHKFNDIVGLTDVLDTNRQINPMAQYLFGDKYRNYEEQKEYYQEGYTPVRQGRWWNFGSSSELRGGKITYFQPNFVIRANSNWYDNAVYGSTKEKWEHSWIPTPRHPLSPLRALLNPYWLEEKHYYDRPYMESAPLFESSMPWSPILNATVGKIIKPTKRMHKEVLTSNFIDVRSLLEKQNEKIKNKAELKSSLINIENGNVSNVIGYSKNEYLSTPVEIDNSNTMKDNYISIKDNDIFNKSLTGYIKKYNTTINSKIGFNKKDYTISNSENLLLNSFVGNMVMSSLDEATPGFVQISKINNSIKSKANTSDTIYLNDKIFNTKARLNDTILKSKQAQRDLLSMTNNKQYINDLIYSGKELSGMYGFLIDTIMPNRTKRYRIENAGKINSFSRKFWEQNFGGYGGEFMEIARRFFPHENHNFIDFNPIKNTMPDWMPDRFRYGDPYTKVQKGEMRLPGKGYESVYKLHPDQFGRYGAFDRYKILADIAPWSEEFRLWRKIAKKTISDKKLTTKMQDIEDRVKKQTAQHEFYHYKFLGQKMNSYNGIIDKVDKDSFSLVGDSKRYKLAGLNVSSEGFNKYIKTGQKVQLRYNPKDYNKNDTTIGVALSIGDLNINKKLLDSKLATKDDNDTTTAALQGTFTNSQIKRGKFYELIAHAPIPYIHSKFMRVNSPLESFKQEQIYGTDYATWQHPIQGFIKPAFEKGWSYGLPYQLLGLATLKYAEKANNKAGNLGERIFADALVFATNPGAVAGAFTGKLLKPSSFNQYTKRFARIGAYASILGFAYTDLDRPINSAINFGLLGAYYSKHLKLPTKQAGIVGAGIGLALSSIRNPNFDKDKMFGPHIPKSKKKQWEIQEYYDRLKYIKYMGLYNKASRKARLFEGTNIKKTLNKLEYIQNEKEKIKEKLLKNRNKLSNNNMIDNKYKSILINKINSKLQILEQEEQIILKGGQYTRAAIAYKQAAESTIYGLKENATWSEILRATPKKHRDYILEFAKEKDKRKRKKIRSLMPEYERKILDILWGNKVKKLESNSSYFKKHFLPGPFWSGWNPKEDLDNVEIKTIKNEGMQQSDFGFYESEYDTYDVQNSPSIKDINGKQSVLTIKKNLFASLQGAGLFNVNVKITPTDNNTINLITNIGKVVDYKIKEKVQNIFNANL